MIWKSSLYREVKLCRALCIIQRQLHYSQYTRVCRKSIKSVENFPSRVDRVVDAEIR